MDKYNVCVGNIGNIPESSRAKAEKTYNEYVRQSKAGFGRGGEEDVTLFIDDEPEKTFSFHGWMVGRLTDNVAKAKRTVSRAQVRLDNYLAGLREAGEI